MSINNPIKNINKLAQCIAVLGTGSDVGKSIAATALCRIFTNYGLKVAPFKAQNMSNNSGVTPNGKEIGRAQIVQAEAAKIPPHEDMNPVLLKPSSDTGAQVVLLGEVFDNKDAKAYHMEKEHFFKTACEALDRLRMNNDLIIMEGAGSCAEVNLAKNDITNLRIAKYADAPVILVSDIHRGGVFAQCIGTLACISPQEQTQITGFLINRFRGDPELFKDGIKWIEEKTSKPVIGLIPNYNDIHIEAEDSVVLEKFIPAEKNHGNDSIGIIKLPHISNFNDFDPLIRTKGISVSFLKSPEDLGQYKTLIIPGSKNTRNDLEWLKQSGWDNKITSYAKSGGYILGICGGYQMLGRVIHDPDGLEGKKGSSNGLNLLPVETILKAPKITTRTGFLWDEAHGDGYEIHLGETKNESRHLFKITTKNGHKNQSKDGYISLDNHIMGTYIHGLFDSPSILFKWLTMTGIKTFEIQQNSGLSFRDKEYDRLAHHFLSHMNMDYIIRAMDTKFSYLLEKT